MIYHYPKSYKFTKLSYQGHSFQFELKEPVSLSNNIQSLTQVHIYVTHQERKKKARNMHRPRIHDLTITPKMVVFSRFFLTLFLPLILDFLFKGLHSLQVEEPGCNSFSV